LDTGDSLFAFLHVHDRDPSVRFRLSDKCYRFNSRRQGTDKSNAKLKEMPMAQRFLVFSTINYLFLLGISMTLEWLSVGIAD